MHVFREALHYPKDPAIRAGAALFLFYLGPEAKLAEPNLRKALDDENVQVRLYAAQILWTLRQDRETADLVVPVLGKILKSKEALYRADAATTLGLIGSRATAALDDLIESLKDPSNDADLRARCCFALGKLGPEAAPAVRELATLVKNGGGVLGEQAAFALYSIGPKAVGSVQELATALRDRNLRLRALAAVALAAIGDGARPAIPALIAALEDNDDVNIRIPIVQALWAVDRQHAPLALPVLLDTIQDTTQLTNVRIIAVNVLAGMETAAKAARPSLLRIHVDEGDEALKAAALAAAERIGPPTAADAKALIQAARFEQLDIPQGSRGYAAVSR